MGQYLSSDSLLQLILITLSLILLYKYFTRNFDFWKKQNVKYISPLPIFGTFKPIYIQTLLEQDIENHNKLGTVFGGFERNNPILYISDPEIMKEICVKKFSSFVDRRHLTFFKSVKLASRALVYLRGEDWKIMRSAVSPGFSSAKLKQMIPIMQDTLNVFITSLEKYAEGKKAVNMRELVSAYSLDVIASCSFGINTNTIDTKKNQFLRAMKTIQNPNILAEIIVFFPIILYMFDWLWSLIVKKTIKFFMITATRILEEKMANNSTEKPVDFLDCLLEAKANAERNGDEKIKKSLDKDGIIAQCISFIIASMESVPTTITMITYSLAKDQEIQEKLIQEIDQLLIEKKNIKYEDINNLTYLDMVYNECLRHYPPFYRVVRTCVANEVSLENGITLNKGMVISFAIYSMLHNSQYFKNPHNFDPERFRPENKDRINMTAFMPFGIGPRQCPAMRFAQILVKLTIFNIFSKYRIKTCSKTEKKVKFCNNRMSFLTPVSTTLLIETRNDQPEQ